MKRLTLFLVSATLLLASAAQAEPTTVITTHTKRVWVYATYWLCRVDIGSNINISCDFKYSRYAWIPQAAWCGLRNIGPKGSHDNVTVCWLHGRRIIGPPPVPASVTPS